MSKKKKSNVKINYKNVAIYVFAAVLIIAVISIGVSFLNSSSGTKTDEIIQEESKATPYSLRSNANEYQKQLFDDLEKSYKSDMTSSETIGNIAKNFVADFYTLSNKTIKNDIGGAQFWYPDYRINFRDAAINSYYFNLELLIDEYGSSNLPTVQNIEVMSVKPNDDNSEWEVYLEWDYGSHSIKDELPTSATITLLEYETGIFIIVLS